MSKIRLLVAAVIVYQQKSLALIFIKSVCLYRGSGFIDSDYTHGRNNINTEVTVEELPIFDGFDTQQLFKRLREKPERLKDILSSFRGGYVNVIAQIEPMLESEQYEAARCELHSLKGVSGNLFMQTLYEKTLDFEQRLKSGDYSQWRDDLLCFSKVLDQTLSQVDDVLGRME